MIPRFPSFKKLEQSDKEDVEEFTMGFECYSDFNFSNMWAWDVGCETILSELNGNLVIIAYNVVTQKPTISFIGNNNISETANLLLDLSKKKYHDDSLRLIPKEITDKLNASIFKITADRDAFDYVYAVSHLARMDTWQNNSSKEIKKFKKLYPDCIVKVSRPDKSIREEYMKLFKVWADYKNIEDYSKFDEYKAFKKFFELTNPNIWVLSLYFDSRVIGFAIHEIVSEKYAISHFAKADMTYGGIFNFLDWQEAMALQERGVKYLNYEEDMGLSGLRYLKEKYKPDFFLEQFSVKKSS